MVLTIQFKPVQTQSAQLVLGGSVKSGPPIIDLRSSGPTDFSNLKPIFLPGQRNPQTTRAAELAKFKDQ
ncbi:hypothetical protein KKF81_03915 [Candidatus Micrarchaeota archaeon]|nr:hypothetical protein [Candidatus Micrarchaeota archaeon]MBU1166071.1 hypothetical protein [Candidatus Micrarchaeota archaeon]MBU1886681.1 hypothetical protein [Candidatus Micrarchaeota archaeon]